MSNEKKFTKRKTIIIVVVVVIRSIIIISDFERLRSTVIIVHRNITTRFRVICSCLYLITSKCKFDLQKNRMCFVYQTRVNSIYQGQQYMSSYASFQDRFSEQSLWFANLFVRCKHFYFTKVIDNNYNNG